VALIAFVNADNSNRSKKQHFSRTRSK